jgi:hypothetical protein
VIHEITTVRRKIASRGSLVIAAAGKREVRCPNCQRPRRVRLGRFTVIHDCPCGTVYRVNCSGAVEVL